MIIVSQETNEALQQKTCPGSLNYFGDIKQCGCMVNLQGFPMDFGVLLVKFGLGSCNDPWMPSKSQVCYPNDELLSC